MLGTSNTLRPLFESIAHCTCAGGAWVCRWLPTEMNDVFGYIRRHAPAAPIACPQDSATCIRWKNNDPMYCEVGDMPPSSVEPGTHRLCREALRCLDEIMARGRLPRPLVIRQQGVSIRRSPDHYACTDADTGALPAHSDFRRFAGIARRVNALVSRD